MEGNANEIDFELVLKFDLDKYADWIMNHKPVSREFKKDQVLSLLGSKEKTIANYRWAINEVFFKTTYWKAPTDFEKNAFLIWRKDAFEEQQERYINLSRGSVMPLEYLKQKEFKVIVTILNEAYFTLIFDSVVNGWLVKDYFLLARFFGIVDHAKKVLAGPSPQQEPTHRMEALAYKYKVAAGIERPLTRKEQRDQGNKAREKAFDSLNKGGSVKYSAPTQNELSRVVELLSKYPIAQKAAINDLDALQN